MGKWIHRKKIMLWRNCFFLVTLIFLLLTACQSFPRGERIEDLDSESYPSIERLNTYYSMCRAAWREREEWHDTGWTLDYFSHEPTNTLGLSIEKEGVLYLVFRSSQAPDNPIDSRLNMHFRLQPMFFAESSMYQAHRGMLSKYEGVYEEVHSRVKAFDGDQLTIVGHSAGGMVGTIAFFDLYHAYPDLDIRAVFFGSSRVLNQRAAKALEEVEHRIVRIVMGRDLIASIPPAFFGYRHVGRIIRMGDQPRWKPFSIVDHYPGQQDELRRVYEQTK